MKEISLTRGLVTLVDDEDYVWLSQFKWQAGHGGYAKRTALHPSGQLLSNGRRKRADLKMHREIMGLTFGDRREVDHIDGNTLNNTRANLRVCTHAENGKNLRKPITNTSGYKGVSYYKRSGKWMAYIMIEKKLKNLGYFDTPQLAHAAYCEAAKRIHGEFANFG